jgi:hypothetical protein
MHDLGRDRGMQRVVAQQRFHRLKFIDLLSAGLFPGLLLFLLIEFAFVFHTSCGFWKKFGESAAGPMQLAAHRVGALAG